MLKKYNYQPLPPMYLCSHWFTSVQTGISLVNNIIRIITDLVSQVVSHLAVGIFSWLSCTIYIVPSQWVFFFMIGTLPVLYPALKFLGLEMPISLPSILGFKEDGIRTQNLGTEFTDVITSRPSSPEKEQHLHWHSNLCITTHLHTLLCICV